jgi:hypothetical protein
MEMEWNNFGCGALGYFANFAITAKCNVGEEQLE